MRTSLAVAGILALVVSMGVAAPAAGPNSHTQPFLDGCLRTNTVITLIPNEWVYVNRAQVLAERLGGNPNAGRATVQGVIRDMHPAGDDEFIAHDYNDIDVDVATLFGLDPEAIRCALATDPLTAAQPQAAALRDEEALPSPWTPRGATTRRELLRTLAHATTPWAPD